MTGPALRLLHAIHDFLPAHRAGSEIYAHHLCRALQDAGHHVTLVCAVYAPQRPHGHVEWRLYDRLPVIEITNNWPAAGFEHTYRDPLMRQRLASALHAVQPHVVHIHNLLNLSFDLPGLALAQGARTVATLHDYTLVCPSGGQRLHAAEAHLCRTIDPARCARCFGESPFGRRLSVAHLAPGGSLPAPLLGAARAARALLPRAFTAAAARLPGPAVSAQDIEVRLAHARRVFDEVDLFVAPARATGAEFIELGVPPHKVRISDYGMSPFEAVSRPGPRGRLRLGFVGTLVPHKGVHLLIDAIRQLPADRVEAVVFGDLTTFPDYTARLRAAAQQLPVRFEGRFSGTDLRQVYGQMDVLVVPSTWLENSPLVIHEAQMAGVPVVGSAIGGIPDLVQHEVNGLLVEPDSVRDLAAALRRLIDEPTLLAGLAAHPMPVKTIEQDAAEWAGVYADVLASTAVMA
ncbi:MAG: glycosyltransferase family 4 protein [Vicinamibacterales bacterium]